MSPGEVPRVAERMLADYDARRPNAIFAERGTDWLTLEDAYAVQRAVAQRRRVRGERCLGYKVGCVSPAIQKQFGLHQPVRGYVWESEAHTSGCQLAYHAFANLAIEGEIALRLSRDTPPGTAGDDLLGCVACWFPVIELHNYVFRGARPTGQELVAGNAMHAGLVSAPLVQKPGLGAAAPSHVERLEHAEIQVAMDGEPVESKSVGELPGGPLGSLRWLSSSLAAAKETLRAGDLVLTGSPGRLIPVRANSVVTVLCAGQQVDLFVGDADL
jgi:2-keto-4-pentenoate hydratase